MNSMDRKKRTARIRPGSRFLFFRTGMPLLALLFPAGCLLFPAGTAPSPDGGYVERVAQPRTERQLERGELVLALWAGPENKIETAAARTALQNGKVRLKIVAVSQREALSPMLRSGRADLIAGAFTPEEIQNLHLLPVLSYSGSDGHTRYCFAVRRGDSTLENLLGPVSAAETPAGGKEDGP